MPLYKSPPDTPPGLTGGAAMSRHRSGSISGQFAPRLIEMLEARPIAFSVYQHAV